MKAQVGVVFRDTLLEVYVVADLETEAIAIVGPGSDVSIRMPVAMLDEYPAGIVTVDLLIFVPVTVKHQIFDHNIVYIFCREERKQCGSCGAL